MADSTRILGVIPARLASTRLPRKMLRQIAGKPMLAWVYAAAKACPQLDEVVVATDSEEIVALCREHGWPVETTPTELPSGTDRVHAVSQRIDAGIYVNIQGDEPLLTAMHISALLGPFARTNVEATTLKVICEPESIGNPNAVKVVTANDGRALYFSRASIPYDRDGVGASYWKHIGLYAYRKQALHRFAALAPSPLELTERLEQLRMLENGMRLYVAETEVDTVGVDTQADLERVEAMLIERLKE